LIGSISLFLIRPITLDDLDAIEQFAYATALGMNSLPRNRILLKEKIERSIESFNTEVFRAKEEIYLFVLEETRTKKTVGCCGIYATMEMACFFRVETLHPYSSILPLPSYLRVLHSLSFKNGPSELCALYLTPEYRKGGLGELLSLSRLLFIASQPQRFNSEVMARLRGFVNKKKNSSPFWEGLGIHFLKVPFVETQHLLETDKSFISEFLPKYPIYVSFLPPQAQAVIGKPHSTTWPAMKMLRKEGFVVTSEIDIFDGGPTLKAKTIKIRTVKNSSLAVIKDISSNNSSHQYLISNNSLDFRATLGRLKINSDNNATLSADIAKVLRVEKGMNIRYI
jgi:arginine N-succinyltransferase